MTLTKEDEQEISEYVSNFLEKSKKKEYLYREILHNLKSWQKLIFYIYNNLLAGKLEVFCKELETHNICSHYNSCVFLQRLESYGLLQKSDISRYRVYDIINVNEWKYLTQLILAENRHQQPNNNSTNLPINYSSTKQQTTTTKKDEKKKKAIITKTK